MNVTEHVLTLWQPYATLMACGVKWIETRGWNTPHRGPLWIHAAQREPEWVRELCHREPFATLLTQAGYAGTHELPRGAVLGRCELYFTQRVGPGFLPPSELERLLGDYAVGRYAWFTRSMRRLRQPLSRSGRQGLWEWNPPAEPEWV